MIIEAVVYQHHEECGVHFNRLSLIKLFLGLSNYIGEDIADVTTKANASLDGLRIAVQDGWDPFDPDSMEEPIVPGMKGEYFPLMVTRIQSSASSSSSSGTSI